ncbi:MAG: S-methyl-5-thioribose-1-phosphate isomerase [Planctomycetota bacterium]
MPQPETIEWVGDIDGHCRIIDQTLLPAEFTHCELRTRQQFIDAIMVLAVRGAPAIGVAGAFGVVVALREGATDAELDELANARPTAVNLQWAVAKVRELAAGDAEKALVEARKIHEQDKKTCRAIGEHGASLIKPGMGILTHCNAGALATGGMGTALAPMYVAHENRVKFSVYADETRPLLQGARLTAFELSESGIDVTVISDSMAAVVMRDKRVQLVITGADRIAANGDAANKIGTYGVAMLANAHGIPFYIAAPKSTFDGQIASGKDIPIEERDGDELRILNERLLIPSAAKTYNPAFDVTPNDLIAGFITEDGILQASEIKAWLTT